MLLPYTFHNKYVPQMLKICHICQLIHEQLCDYYVFIYTSYSLNAINNVTRSSCICNYIQLHTYAPKQTFLSHCTCMSYYSSTLSQHSTLHSSTHPTKINNCHICWPHYYQIDACNKYGPQMPQIRYMSILHYVHLWGRYAIINTIYEAAPIKIVIKITVQRCQWLWWCRMMKMLQPNYINSAGHFAKSIKKE